MPTDRTSARVTRIALRTGMAVPPLYFGTQLMAAMFYPGYSFLTMDASTLGSDRSTFPMLFNTGVIMTGLAELVAAFGFQASLKRLGANQWLTWLVFFALAQNGLATIWAGYFPAPDPRHNTGMLGAIGLLVLPALLVSAIWSLPDFRALKTYLIVTCVLILALIPLMSGATGLDTRTYSGVLQRIVALIAFLPIAVGAHSLARRWPVAH